MTNISFTRMAFDRWHRSTSFPQEGASANAEWSFRACVERGRVVHGSRGDGWCASTCPSCGRRYTPSRYRFQQGSGNGISFNPVRSGPMPSAVCVRKWMVIVSGPTSTLRMLVVPTPLSAMLNCICSGEIRGRSSVCAHRNRRAGLCIAGRAPSRCFFFKRCLRGVTSCRVLQKGHGEPIIVRWCGPSETFEDRAFCDRAGYVAGFDRSVLPSPFERPGSRVWLDVFCGERCDC